jgi:transposase-like protein
MKHMMAKKQPDALSEELRDFFLEAAEDVKKGTPLTGPDGVFTPLMKRFVELALNKEMDHHLASAPSGKNRRNGYGKKTIQTTSGQIQIQPPRDREGSFEPELVPKRSTMIAPGMEGQILSLYARGMSYSDIRAQLWEIYGMEVSEARISAITDAVLEDARAWQDRPLENLYTIVWMDAMHFKVRQDGLVQAKAVYTLLGVNQHGFKEVLGLYIADTESAKFWLHVLGNLRRRGVEDILIACIDNLKGFEEAILLEYPATFVQSCIVHQVRNSLSAVPWKHYKEMVADMRAIYTASTLELAEVALDEFCKKWEKEYPRATTSWRANWHKLSTFLEFPDAIRKLIYTTNPIESLHSEFRKITKTKRAFTSESALIKLLFLAQRNISKKWEDKPTFGWKQILAQLHLIFPGRLEEERWLKPNPNNKNKLK